MNLSDLKPNIGAVKKRKRVGRGPGSGHGKTSCKGHKGARARAGGKKSPGFEGGQMPLYRRLPKRGFTNIFKKAIEIVNLSCLGNLNENEIVTPEFLLKNGIINSTENKVKILGNGEITTKLTIKAHFFSKSAKEKIEQAGGIVEVL